MTGKVECPHVRYEYVLDGNQLLEDFGSTPIVNGAAADDSVYLVDRYIAGPNVDEVLGIEKVPHPLTQPGTIFFTETDALESIRDLATSAGINVAHFQYNAYGKLESATNLLTGEPIGDLSQYTYVLFTGKLTDPVTGEQINWHRWYDPATGNWMSQDPLGFAAGSMNLSDYVGNAPVMLIDPLGLKVTTIKAVAKSYIDDMYNTGGTGRIPDPSQSYLATNFAFQVFSAFAYLSFREHPTNDLNDGQNRLFTQVNIAVNVSDDRIQNVNLTTEKRGGTEPGGYTGTINMRTSMFFVDKDTVRIGWMGWGRPDSRVEWSFQAITPRTAKEIWHIATIEIRAVNCDSAEVIKSTLRGSAFPSHALWIDGKEVQRKTQGNYTSLWRSDPTLGADFVTENGTGPWAQQYNAFGPVNWNTKP